MNKLLRVLLIIQTLFLGITALLGGLALITGWNSPPLSELNGSVFKNFTIPGVSLFLIVGGSGFCAAVSLFRKNQFANLLSIAAGAVIMFFEFVEVLTIGSPPGAARTLQIVYFGLGFIIIITALAVRFMEITANQTSPKTVSSFKE